MSLLGRLIAFFYQQTPRYVWRSQMKEAIESAQQEVEKMRPTGNAPLDIITGDYDTDSPMYRRRGGTNARA